MIGLIRNPQLVQCVPSAPSALYGIDRRNLGYRGPTVFVRRTSDGTSRDCYNQQDIASFCAGTNGFVVTAYDQTGAGRDITMGTQSRQPKCHDSATGLILAGKTASLSFVSGSSQNLVKGPETGGFSAGNVAFTMAYNTSAWTWPGTSVVIAQCGPDTGGANQDTFYTGRNTSTQLYVADRLGNVIRNWNVNPDTNKQYVVVSKASGVNFDQCVIRQNGAALSTGTQVSGTLNFNTAASMVNWGCAMNVQQWCTVTAQMLGFWTTQLLSQDLSALEAALEAERTAT